MEETKHNNFGVEVQKTPLDREDCDILQTEREISSTVESPGLKLQDLGVHNEIPETCSSKIPKQHCKSPVDFGTAKKKKSPSQAGDISKLENEVSLASSTLKFRGNSLELETEINFSLAKKKKKKKPAFLSENKVPTDDECPIVSFLLDDLTIADSFITDKDSDYPYEYLLSRLFDLMREKNSEVDKTVRKKLIMKPPQVLRAGTKRTSFANFLELCKVMRRTPQHVQSFLLVELGTNGSIDSNGQLVIKGKFQQKQLENVLRRYIKEYVTCHTCHSPDTVLLKQTRLCFLQCEACGSRCSVPVIKSGFQAVINKRAAMRAKFN